MRGANRRRRRALAVLLAWHAGSAAQDGAGDLLELFDAVENAPVQQAPLPPVHDERARALLEALAIVTVTVDGVRDAAGSVRVLAFADAGAWEAFDATRAVGYGSSAAQPGSVTVTLRAVDAGPYALFVFHDADDDETLDRRGGLPLEAWGYSGTGAAWPPPSFTGAATVTVAGRVRLVYPEAVRRR